jgi:hypothetical protein
LFPPNAPAPRISSEMPENDKPPYPFSTHIVAACNKQMKTFHDLAQRLGMDMIDLMLQCNGREVAAVIRALLASTTVAVSLIGYTAHTMTVFSAAIFVVFGVYLVFNGLTAATLIDESEGAASEEQRAEAEATPLKRFVVVTAGAIYHPSLATTAATTSSKKCA